MLIVIVFSVVYQYVKELLANGRAVLRSFPFSVFTFPFSNAKVWQEKGDRKKTRWTQMDVHLHPPVSTSKPFLGEIFA